MYYANQKIYLDHAATTALLPEVFAEMKPYLTGRYGNPSATYQLAELSERAIQNAREEIAMTINASPNEIFFTSGGSESDNWALKGAVDYAALHQEGYRKVHMVTTAIEHHAILKTASYLRTKGILMSMVYPDEMGYISVDKIAEKIKRETVLVSVMYANNEIGTIQPIGEIGNYIKERDILFHTDAVQAFGQLDIDVKKENIDLLSASGHKIGGPKGIGFLYIKGGKNMEPFIHGGGQEHGLRSGTENVASIVGLGTAAKLAYKRMENRNLKLLTMRNYLKEYLLQELDDCQVNGSECDLAEQWSNHKTLKRLPGNLNITIKDINATEMIARLDELGICASTASACTKHSHSTSHVLRAIGLTEEGAMSTIRLTLGEDNNIHQVQYAAKQIVRISKEMREKRL